MTLEATGGVAAHAEALLMHAFHGAQGANIGQADAKGGGTASEKADLFAGTASRFYRLGIQRREMVGVRGFEPPAPASRKQCSTRLSYTPPTGRDI